jgi:probable rRNA maturation factor
VTSATPFPSLRIAVGIEKAGWNRALPEAAKIGRQVARRAVKAALATSHARIRQLAGRRVLELALVLADDAGVQVLNRTYRGKDKPTNVLSFASLDSGPLETAPRRHTLPAEMPLHLGDVVLALETLKTEARAQRKTFKQHYSHLVAHGVLHLLGFDHERDQDARRMEDLERDILAGLGWPDPYQSQLEAR